MFGHRFLTYSLPKVAIKMLIAALLMYIFLFKCNQKKKKSDFAPSSAESLDAMLGGIHKRYSIFNLIVGSWPIL